MNDEKQTNWPARGNLFQRMAKESLIVFPVALVMTYYGSLRYSSRIDVSPLMFWGIVVLLTVGMSGYFAHKSQRTIARRPAPRTAPAPEQIEPK
jgi:hypothetical protein